MPETKNVTPEELATLQEIRKEVDTHIITLGQIQYQRTLLDLQEQRIKAYIIDTKEREKGITDDLIKKYGNVMVDIETGTIS